MAVDHRDTPLQVIREAIYKSIRNDVNYTAEEMKKDVVKQFQDQYLLKVTKWSWW